MRNNIISIITDESSDRVIPKLTPLECFKELRIIVGAQVTRILAPKNRLALIEKALGRECHVLYQDLNEFLLMTQKEGVVHKGVSAHLTNELQFQNITIMERITNNPEHYIYVTKGEALKTLQILTSLTQENS